MISKSLSTGLGFARTSVISVVRCRCVASTLRSELNEFWRCLHEHHLVVLVRVGHQLVVVELEQKRDLRRVPARAGAELAECRDPALQPSSNRQIHDGVGVEVDRVGRERTARPVLDALVDAAGSKGNPRPSDDRCRGLPGNCGARESVGPLCAITQSLSRKRMRCCGAESVSSNSPSAPR